MHLIIISIYHFFLKAVEWWLNDVSDCWYTGFDCNSWRSLRRPDVSRRWIYMLCLSCGRRWMEVR